MKISAVVGMNYGDEGKGHIVNYLSDARTLNVRFNGGAQAGHGVKTSSGQEHIFHHFGSGTLRGARTLFAPHFIVNPLMFFKELKELLDKKAPVREVFVDPLCRISTPYDMLINEYASKQEGTTMTCGLGINETVERSQYRQLKILARDLVDKSEGQLKDVLYIIENEYLPYRLEKLHLDDREFRRWAIDKMGGFAIVDNFVDYARRMMKNSVMWETSDLLERYCAKEPGRQVVFEGAQGMRLDQKRKDLMPYLTRSSTGMRNVVEVLNRLRSEVELDVYLVTRTYLTRHGDGPVLNEVDGLPYKGVENYTNPENKFQGAMRYGYLDLDWCKQAVKEIKEDLGKVKYRPSSTAKVGVALTCLDHLTDFTKEFRLRTIAGVSTLSLLRLIHHEKSGVRSSDVVAAFPDLLLFSTGRTEKDVQPFHI